MGERAVQIGKKLEGFGQDLFVKLGWIELARDREIACNRHTHSKRTHGLDLVMKFGCPYISRKQGIVIECKNRKMCSITQSEIQKWVEELIYSIECAQSSPELADLDLEDTMLNTGLLLVHAHDKFDEAKFYQYLTGIVVKGRRNPINIFVAGNDKIDQWNTLTDYIGMHFHDNFTFIYPSINGSQKTSTPCLSINSLYSKFFFGQNIAEVNNLGTNGLPFMKTIRQAVMFSFDEPSKSSFKYMWSMFKHYQFEDCDEYIFIFYPRKNSDVEFVKTQFEKSLSGIREPLSEHQKQRIKIDFLKNRTLSPVDN